MNKNIFLFLSVVSFVLSSFYEHHFVTTECTPATWYESRVIVRWTDGSCAENIRHMSGKDGDYKATCGDDSVDMIYYEKSTGHTHCKVEDVEKTLPFVECTVDKDSASTNTTKKSYLQNCDLSVIPNTTIEFDVFTDEKDCDSVMPGKQENPVVINVGCSNAFLGVVEGIVKSLNILYNGLDAWMVLYSEADCGGDVLKKFQIVELDECVEVGISPNFAYIGFPHEN